jgi:hypothetical protein
MEDTPMTTTADLIRTFTAAAEELEAAVSPTRGCTTVSSHNWIVLDPYGQPCQFDVEHLGGKTRKAIVVGKGMPHKVNRWEREAAATIAAQIGDCSIALWQDATAAKAAEYRELIDFIAA